MDETILIYIVLGSLALFVLVLVLFLTRQKRQKAQSITLQKMMTSSNTNFTMDVFYQKVYLAISTIPVIRRYVYKIRRRLEMLNNEDEYVVRKETAKISLRGLIGAIVFSIGLAYINREDLFMMMISLVGVLVVIENLTDMMVNKVEDKLLKQQLELFSEVRHSFHETSMVEEAIYEASLLEDYEVTLQADRIYEIMVSSEPEAELEKYYDVAPNRFLKAFAGVSYLTKEFGDRKVNDVSLYLKNMNNITQELQLEILKRDKLDYLFKSLTFITLAPILFIIPLRNWAISSFESTRPFYEGKIGFIMQVGMLVLIFICYALLRKVKENNDRIRVSNKKDTPWQERVYRTPLIEQFIDNLMPNASQREYVKIRNLLKETASPLKMEWLYVNRIVYAILGFFVMIILLNQLHSLTIKSVLYDATMEQSVLGQASDKSKNEANALTSFDRYYLSSLADDNSIVKSVREDSESVAISNIASAMRIINNTPMSQADARVKSERVYAQLEKGNSLSTKRKANIERAILDSKIELPITNYVTALSENLVERMKDNDKSTITLEMLDQAIIEVSATPLTEQQIQTNATRIYGKLQTLLGEYIKWTEILIAFLIAWFTYYLPVIILMFQRKMRAMEMEDEVMQFQTIILMLMHIERVSVEYIIEWLERFANIFKDPLATCLNNYESGAWQALEQLKEDAPFKPFVRIVESLQSAVENVKITDAFDELETERNFFQEKRKEANERLIMRKSKLGKVLGFAPMVVLFVGYLIVPLIYVSVADMGTYFSQMGSML